MKRWELAGPDGAIRAALRRRRWLGCVAAVLAFASPATEARAQPSTTGAAPAQLAITSAPLTSVAGSSAVDGPVTVTLEDADGDAVAAPGDTVVSLASSSSTGVFASAPGGPAAASVTIPAGQSTATFYYGDASAGAPTLTASSPGLAAGSQAETIESLNPRIVFTAAPASGTASATATVGPFTVEDEDQFGNPIPAPPGGSEVDLLAVPDRGAFAAAAGGSPTASVTIPAGSSSVSFYYGSTAASTYQITARIGPVVSAEVTVSIGSGPPATAILSGAGMVQTLTSPVANAGVTVSFSDAFGNAYTAPSGGEPVSLSIDSPTGFFAAVQGGPPVTSVTIPAGEGSVAFWWGDTVVGQRTLTVTAGDAVVTVADVPVAAHRPSPPTGVAAEAGDGSATVSWNASVTDPGAPITAYTVTASDGHTCAWAGGPLSCTVTGLTAGGTYTFTVTAKNSGGTGDPSAASAPVTLPVPDTTPPVLSGVPLDRTVTAASVAGAGVTYQAPTALDAVDGPRPVVCAPASGTTFPLGTTTVTCTAADTHGNTATATFTITVTPTPAILATLTLRDVQSSANYKRLNPIAKVVVSLVVKGTTSLLADIGPRLRPERKAELVDAYERAVRALVKPGWLTEAQAATLEELAGEL